MGSRHVPFRRLRSILEILALARLGRPHPRQAVVGIHAPDRPHHRLDRARTGKSELSRAQRHRAENVPEGEAAGVHAREVGLEGALRVSGQRRAGHTVSQGPGRRVLRWRTYILSYKSREVGCHEGGVGYYARPSGCGDGLVLGLFLAFQAVGSRITHGK